MSSVMPSSSDELCRFLKDCTASSRTVNVIGANSKQRYGGPVAQSDETISMSRFRRVLQYEPNDLTVSVEAGMPWSELQATLSRNGQMVALDPPFAQQATVGGVVAANSSGSMRRGYGTARDLVIGMQFATLDGGLVRAGGMVVKNVAGLDMGKLMIGSFGSLAVITSVNFRLHPVPELTQTFLRTFADLRSAVASRDNLLKSPLRPFAVDLLTPAAAARFDLRGYVLAVRAGGSRNVMERYARELGTSQRLTGRDDERLWETVREFVPDYLNRQPNGAVVRISTALTEIEALLQSVSDTAIARATSGVTYVFTTSVQSLQAVWAMAEKRGWNAVVEAAPDSFRLNRKLWLASSRHSEETFALMGRVKQMFDPQALLNRGRLYGRL